MTTAVRDPLASSDLASAIRDQVGAAVEAREPLRVGGRGTWLRAGRPVITRASLTIPHASEPTEYVPGDLTITVPAGMTLGSLRSLLARHGQWLALDPHGSDDGTIGATVATGSAGPLSHAFGTPRDQVLGLEMVTGRANIVRAGGRVVKNVAGFDLVRLAAGSWGTIGVITEVTLRLRAIAEEDTTIALGMLPDRDQMAALLNRLRAAPIAPWSLEMLNPGMARAIGLPGEPVILARLGGSRASVSAQRRALEAHGTCDTVASSIWSSLRSMDLDATLVLRWSDWPTTIPELFVRARRLVEAHGGLVHATLGRGVVRAIVPAADAQAVAAIVRGIEARRVVEVAPAPMWREIPSAVGDRLSRRALDAFDPERVLNPGILGASE